MIIRIRFINAEDESFNILCVYVFFHRNIFLYSYIYINYGEGVWVVFSVAESPSNFIFCLLWSLLVLLETFFRCLIILIFKQ